MRTDLWTLMRAGSGGGGGGGGGRVDKPRPQQSTAADDPAAQPSADFSDTPSSPSVVDEPLHLRPDSIAFSATPDSGPLRRPRGPPPPPPPQLWTPPDLQPMDGPQVSPPPDPAADRPQQRISLPRRSILAPEKKADDDDEDEDDDGVRHQPKRSRSRILGELRPVASPREAAAISTPLSVAAREPELSTPPLWLPDEPEDASDDAEYFSLDDDARRRAFDVFASRRVRLQRKWGADLWLYMKNSHPVLGLGMAHRWHPYRSSDRALVLLVAIGVAMLLSGIVATRSCCTEVGEPSAVFPPLPLASTASSKTVSAASTLECQCGLAHTSALVAVVIAAVIPFTILLLEPLVTLYLDSKLCGCIVRSRPRPSLGSGQGCISYRVDGLAAKLGRAFLVLLLIALSFAIGLVASRANDEQSGGLHSVVVEWVVMCASALALGLLGFCSLVWLAIFTVRWTREDIAAKKSGELGDESMLVHTWTAPTDVNSTV